MRSCGIRSRSHSCSSYSLGQLLARPLRATTVPMVDDSVQFIDGVNVPVIMRDSGSAPDSVHRGHGGHSSSQQRQVDDGLFWRILRNFSRSSGFPGVERQFFEPSTMKSSSSSRAPRGAGVVGSFSPR